MVSPFSSFLHLLLLSELHTDTLTDDDYGDRYSRRDAAEDMSDKMDRMISGGLGDRDEGRRSRYDDDRHSRYDAPAPRQPSYYDAPAPAPAPREPEPERPQLRKPSDVLGPSGAQWDPPASLAQYSERPSGPQSGWRVEPSKREPPAPYQHPTGDDRYPNRKLLPKGAYSGPGGIPMMGPYTLAGPDGMVRDMSNRSYGRGRFMKVEDWEKERDERRARGNRW